MDKIDIILLQLLLANSRLSYAKLAEKLGLSVNAVHKRIQALVEAGVIHKFTVKLGTILTQKLVVIDKCLNQL